MGSHDSGYHVVTMCVEVSEILANTNNTSQQLSAMMTPLQHCLYLHRNTKQNLPHRSIFGNKSWIQMKRGVT